MGADGVGAERVLSRRALTSRGFRSTRRAFLHALHERCGPVGRPALLRAPGAAEGHSDTTPHARTTHRTPPIHEVPPRVSLSAVQ